MPIRDRIHQEIIKKFWKFIIGERLCNNILICFGAINVNDELQREKLM